MSHFSSSGIARIIFLLAILFASLSIAHSEDRIRQTNIDYDEGDWLGYSEHRFINSIAIGYEFVYFATNFGIIRYNYFANKWEFPWTKSNGLASNTILVVAFDENTNYLWCATPQGVSCYQPGLRIWSNIYETYDTGTAFGTIHSIGFGTDAVWLLSENGKAFVGDNQMADFNETRENFDSRDIKWFGQRGWRHVQLTPLFMSDGYLFDTRGIIQDMELRKYEITYYLPDKWGMMWFGTAGLGVARADVRTDRMDLMPYGLMQSDISAFVLTDSYFWICGKDPDYEVHNFGEESGVTLWDINHDEWRYFQAKYISGFSTDQITSIAADNDTLWFGTEQGVVKFSPDENTWLTIDQRAGLRNDYVFDVVVDSHDVWVATPAGIDRFGKFGTNLDSVNVSWIAREDIREIEVYDLEFMDDILWAGTEYGAYYYNTSNDSGHFFELGLLGPGTKAVYAVSWSGSEVWFGLADGIEIFDFKKGDWCPTPKRRLNMKSQINMIRANAQVAWVGTSEGAWKYDRDRTTWRLFTTNDGLIDNNVQTIWIDGDYVWFGTPQGLTKFYWNSSFRID
ncbi:hypothetical protein JXJ21_14765 [candidate division KSB1 bacterium]|nr:hypothetical protein [candidate division KSB1 bacterium]